MLLNRYIKIMEKKKLIIAGSTTAAVAILGLGAFALFSDNAVGGTASKAGTVDVELGDVELENAGNINPGDNDETIPETYIPDPNDPLYKDEDEDGIGDPVVIPTTSHDLTFDVSNVGTKSIRTRQTLIVTCEQEIDGEKVILDPSYLSLLIERGVELGSIDGLGTKTYILSDGSEVAEWPIVEEPEEEMPEVPADPETPVVPEDPETPVDPENPETPVVPEDPETPVVPENPETPANPEDVPMPASEEGEDEAEELYVVAIKYQLTPDIFDGVGDAAEVEELSTVKAVDGVAAKTYTYMLKMAANTPNEYQGATINIDVVLEGMQYRNTGAADWELMSTQSVSGVLTGINQATVPNRAE